MVLVMIGNGLNPGMDDVFGRSPLQRPGIDVIQRFRFAPEAGRHLHLHRIFKVVGCHRCDEVYGAVSSRSSPLRVWLCLSTGIRASSKSHASGRWSAITTTEVLISEAAFDHILAENYPTGRQRSAVYLQSAKSRGSSRQQAPHGVSDSQL